MIKGFLINIDSLTHLKWSWVLCGALLFQLAGIYLMPIEAYGGFITAALAGSYLLLLAGVVANLRVLGFKVMFAGAALNFLVIAFNSWRMPVTPEALRKAGFIEESAFAPGSQLPDPKNILLLEEETNLSLFSDIIPSTFPIHSVWSIGDLLIILGLMLVLLKLGRALLPNSTPQKSTSPGSSADHLFATEKLTSAHQLKEVKQ